MAIRNLPPYGERNLGPSCPKRVQNCRDKRLCRSSRRFLSNGLGSLSVCLVTATQALASTRHADGIERSFPDPGKCSSGGNVLGTGRQTLSRFRGVAGVLLHPFIISHLRLSSQGTIPSRKGRPTHTKVAKFCLISSNTSRIVAAKVA